MYFLRTQSGALYGAEGQSRILVDPIQVDMDISPLLRAAVERENACDVGEQPTVPEEDRYIASSLDDIGVLPHITCYQPPSASIPQTTPGKNAGKKWCKKARKEVEFWAQEIAGSHARSAVEDLVELALSVDVDVSKLPAKKGGYGAKMMPFKNRGAVHDTDSLEVLGLRRVRWGGVNPRPAVDRNSTFAMCLIGCPNKEDYLVDYSNVLDVMQDVSKCASFKPSQKHHKCGTFPAVNAGFVAGQGQTKPTPMDTGKAAPIVEELLANASIQRVMMFQSSALHIWVPRLYGYVKHVVTTVCLALSLSMNFPHSVLPCVAFNLGPNVWMHAHQDVMNFAANWCFITAVGNHDPTKHGFLVVWELGIVIEFPHGAIIAIPSATLMHSNTPVTEDEVCMSIMQYMPRGVARWVDAGCLTEKQLKVENRKAYDKLQAKKVG